jgi:sulfatase maturation enzyme AslB (radical SAM superfamily)
LLSGNLQPPCQRCHIRETVPIDVLKRRLREAGPTNALDPLPIAEIRIDINEKCNLRCDYCAVSSPDYRVVEMSADVFEKVEAFLDRIGPRMNISVNGHGETTYHPNWVAMCRKILDSGYRLQLTTNLAKNYSDEEVEMLSRFYVVQVSLDSDDGELMQRIRKAVRVENVFATLRRIRDVAARRGAQNLPLISFSIGVYHPSIWTLERFVDRLIEFGVQGLAFWTLVERPHQKQVQPAPSSGCRGQAARARNPSEGAPPHRAGGNQLHVLRRLRFDGPGAEPCDPMACKGQTRLELGEGPDGVGAMMLSSRSGSR